MSDLTHIIFDLAELKRQVGQMVRVGTVLDVSGDKIRMVLGSDDKGQPIPSPWLHTGNHRGGARERRFYKKGQNVAVFMPGGDPRQGIIIPYAPNKDFKKPDHANDTGQDEETYQLEDLRVKKTKDGYDIWLEAAGETSGDARMKLRLNNDGGFTARIGKKVRLAAHEKGAKVWALGDDGKKHFVAATKDGLIASEQLTINPVDPIPDDDN